MEFIDGNFKQFRVFQPHALAIILLLGSGLSSCETSLDVQRISDDVVLVYSGPRLPPSEVFILGEPRRKQAGVIGLDRVNVTKVDGQPMSLKARVYHFLPGPHSVEIQWWQPGEERILYDQASFQWKEAKGEFSFEARAGEAGALVYDFYRPHPLDRLQFGIGIIPGVAYGNVVLIGVSDRRQPQEVPTDGNREQKEESGTFQIKGGELVPK